jgi:hypothetical protein
VWPADARFGVVLKCNTSCEIVACTRERMRRYGRHDLYAVALRQISSPRGGAIRRHMSSRRGHRDVANDYTSP